MSMVQMDNLFSNTYIFQYFADIQNKNFTSKLQCKLSMSYRITILLANIIVHINGYTITLICKFSIKNEMLHFVS